MRFSRFSLDVLTAAYVLGCERVARVMHIHSPFVPHSCNLAVAEWLGAVPAHTAEDDADFVMPPEAELSCLRAT